jgi:hypothetical protein
VILLGLVPSRCRWAWTSAAADLTGRHPVDENAFEINGIHVIRDHDDEFYDILLGRLTTSGSLMPMKIVMSPYDDGVSFECALRHLRADDVPLSLNETLVFFNRDFRLGPALSEINERLTDVMFFPLGSEPAYEGSSLHITGLILAPSISENNEEAGAEHPSFTRIGFLSYHLPLAGKSTE